MRAARAFLGHDLRATAAATVLGLSVALSYRYVIKPALQLRREHRDSEAGGASPHLLLTKDSPPAAAAVELLSAASDLDALLNDRVVLLIARGYSPEEASLAKQRFYAAVATLTGGQMGEHQHQHGSQAQLRYFVVDDSSAVAPVKRLTDRLGFRHQKPFVMILDRYKITEAKYLMQTTADVVPSSDAIVGFVSGFVGGHLQPARLGQPRPENDRAERFPALYEVVTDSFADVVLDPTVDVLLVGTSSMCDACTAFTPRIRMLACLAAKHWPGTLRVAEMDILDNDRPLEFMPERWTPSVRLFVSRQEGPAAASVKRAVLFGSAPTAELGKPATDIELPSLPQLLSFIEAETSGRVKLSSACLAEAEKLEAEACALEDAYARLLQVMQLWTEHDALLQHLPASSAEAKAATAELRSRIIRAYRFIAEEGGPGTAHQAAQLVADVTALAREAGVA